MILYPSYVTNQLQIGVWKDQLGNIIYSDVMFSHV